MLHFLRRAAKTWVFRLLFGVLIISFAVWGIGDVGLGGADAPVATVGDQDVTREAYAEGLAREMNVVSRRSGQQIDLAQARAMGLPQSVLARMVRDAALNDETARLGISADDHALRDAILASPSFKGLNGKFDDQQYRFVLDRLGFTIDQFEEDLRRSLARDIVSRGVTSGTSAAPGLADLLAAQALERRTFATLALSLDQAPAPGAPTEDQLAQWHKDHQAEYQAPETRSAVWLEIDPQALVAEIDVPEADLKAAYEADTDRFNKPRMMAIDLLAFPDEAAAQAAADAIASGESDFAAQVEARGLDLADVDEGEVAETDLPEAAGKLVFAAETPGVVGPAESSLGPALYNIRAIIPAQVTPFAEAEPTLRAELAAAEARDLAHEKAEQAQDLLASGATLEDVAKETGLPLKTAEGLTRADMEAATGLEADPAVIDEVFSAEPGEIRDLVETNDGGYVIVRVDSVTPAAPMDLDAARAQVEADWAEAQRREELRKMAEAAKAKLDAGASLYDLAGELGAEVEETSPLRRDMESDLLPAAAEKALFSAPLNGAAVADTDGGVVLAQLVGIMPADLTQTQAKDLVARWRGALDQSIAQDLYIYYAAAVQNRIGVQFNQLAMEEAIAQIR